MRGRLAGIVLIAIVAQEGVGLAASGFGPEIRELTSEVTLRGETLTLHLAIPSAPVSPGTPLVLYASGDGGWFGAAVNMFRTLARSGYPVVGISSRSFMHIERRKSAPLTVAEVDAGYHQIIAAARARLSLPADVPVVLTGWSRGASLAVLVASSPDVDPRVIGVVAIGLAADEQLDIDDDSDDDSAAVASPHQHDAPARAIAMYPLLSRIASRRTVVIQASHDGYLAAARARELFGADTPARRLLAIEARNHRFDGGKQALTSALAEALDWVSRKGDEPQ